MGTSSSRRAFCTKQAAYASPPARCASYSCRKLTMAAATLVSPRRSQPSESTSFGRTWRSTSLAFARRVALVNEPSPLLILTAYILRCRHRMLLGRTSPWTLSPASQLLDEVRTLSLWLWIVFLKWLTLLHAKPHIMLRRLLTFSLSIL